MKCFFPILSNTYWFLTSYIGLYLLIPILNATIELFQKKGCLGIVAAVFYIVTNIYPQFYPIHGGVINGGRTLSWMITLYFLAAAVKDRETSTAKAILLVILSYAALYFSRLILSDRAMILFTNQSPFVVGLSFGIFILVRKMLYGRNSPQFVTFFASSTLSVYLVHECYLKTQLWQFVDDISKGSPVGLLIAPVLIYSVGAIFHFLISKPINGICSAKYIVSSCEKMQSFIYANMNTNQMV